MTRNAAFTAYLHRQALRYGEKFDPSNLSPVFAQYFQGPRIRVETTYGDGTTFTRTGTVSVTTGHRPSLMLMHRSNDSGSWDLLTMRSDTRITHVQHGRTYVPIANLYRDPNTVS